MGVRGLTSYIARKAEKYLKPYELHDCNLVIDGDNLACNLYKDVTGTYSAFGGDYDDFYRAVVNFFTVLSECNIRAYVLMDGGYEQKKIRTVANRLRGKITMIKRINPCGSASVFPLHMKEVFLDALADCEVAVMRCLFEADEELAALARKLNCPVLSYDSDFYIHNVKYIPLITLTVKAHTKEYTDIGASANTGRNLRRNEAKRLVKRTGASKIIKDGIVTNQTEKYSKKQKNTYKFLDCCIYQVENLVKKGLLSKEKLPLFAAMLGNDYIARSAFKNFFLSGMGKIGRSKKMNQQQKRIKLILRWLRSESLESAIERILTRLKKEQRASLLAQVEAAVSGYSNEECVSYDYFSKFYDVVPDYNNEDPDVIGNDEVSESDREIIADGDSEGNESDNEGENKLRLNERKYEVSSDDESGKDEKNDDDENVATTFPDWFLKKLYPGNLPRYFVDLLHLKKYIASPQIEHFPFPDCNEIAIPILIYAFTLLHSVEGEETIPKVNEDGEEQKIEFSYLGRAPKVTNVRYQRYAIEERPKYVFRPRAPNPRLICFVFEKGMHHTFNSKKLFDSIYLIPEDLQLFFLAIVYWLQKSQHCDLVHLHSLILCLVTLRTIDSNIPPIRDLKEFQKRFGKIISKEKQIRITKALQGTKRHISANLLGLSIPERMEHMPKSDCYLVQDNLLKHFHMQEIFKKKYDLFSSTVLHAFAEFQAVLFQLVGLNALLDSPFIRPKMGGLYCGVYLYNLYDLLRNRVDIKYHVENFLFQDSQMMFDFYCYLYDWCEQFIPPWKLPRKEQAFKPNTNRRIQRKEKPLVRSTERDIQNRTDNVDYENDFVDLNNKFTYLNLH